MMSIIKGFSVEKMFTKKTLSEEFHTLEAKMEDI